MSDPAWQLQDAKNRFSEVVREAIESGPQTVTRRGEPVAVVVSMETWKRLNPDQMGFKDYLTSVSLSGLDLDRDKSHPRSVDLP